MLLHGAERSGPPIYALRVIGEWASTAPRFDVEVVIARPGPLVDEFGRMAPTTTARLDRSSPERMIERCLRFAHLGSAGAHVTAAATRWRTPRTRPDLTVVNGVTAATVELLEALDTNGAVVTIAHELSTGWFANVSEHARAVLLSRSSAFLAVSESVRRFLVEEIGVRPEAVTVVLPPVDHSGTDRSDRRPRGGVSLVGGMGMTDWRKAPESWLRVAALVIDRTVGQDVRFCWVGGNHPGSPAAWPLEHEVRQLNLEDVVRFTGTVSSPWTLLGEADVMVSTAREDAYPLACAEAISRGIPVVGFDVDGVGEMVRASGCGVVVPYPDESAVADAVVMLIRDEGVRTSMASNGLDYGRRELTVEHIAPLVGDWLMEQAS